MFDHVSRKHCLLFLFSEMEENALVMWVCGSVWSILVQSLQSEKFLNPKHSPNPKPTRKSAAFSIHMFDVRRRLNICVFKVTDSFIKPSSKFPFWGERLFHFFFFEQLFNLGLLNRVRFSLKITKKLLPSRALFWRFWTNMVFCYPIWNWYHCVFMVVSLDARNSFSMIILGNSEFGFFWVGNGFSLESD